MPTASPPQSTTSPPSGAVEFTAKVRGDTSVVSTYYKRNVYDAADEKIGDVTKIKEEPSFNHYEVVREFVKTVASTEMDYSFARLCATAVDDTLAKSAAKS